jgi:CYTH domain-containing protein
MENMEIERKFLIKEMPDLEKYPFKELEQGYLSTSPTVRVRREDDEYYLTYKSKARDDIAREEYNLPLTEEAYKHLIKKADGNVITKRRYLVPAGKGRDGRELIAEIDVFAPPFAPLILAEVEFSSVEEAQTYEKPDWLGEDVSSDRRYYNSYLSTVDPEGIIDIFKN